MKVKFFTVPVLDPEIAEAELNRFLAEHRVLSVDRRLVESDAGNVWSICIYVANTVAAKSPSSAVSASKRNKVDYREKLSDEDFAVYAKLRELRKAFAEEQAIPAYAVFTNEQLASMVLERVKTKSALAKIEGVSEAKIKKYGDAFLKRLNEVWAGAVVNGAAHA